MLGTALLVVVWVLVVVLALVIVLSVIPYHLRISASSDPEPEIGVELRLLSARLPRLLSVAQPLSRGGKDGPGATPMPTAKPPKRSGKRKRPFGRRMRRAMPYLARSAPGLARDTLGRIHIDRAAVRGEFGFTDPADTGRVYGALTPLIYARIGSRLEFDLSPRFDGACARGRAEMALHLVPIALAWPAIRTLWRAFIWQR